MRRFFEFAAALLVGYTVLIAGTHALARRSPPGRVVALLPDGACRAPCWQGLRPGYVPPETLEAWLTDPPGNWQASPIHPDGAPVGVVDSWQITLPGASPLILTAWRLHNPEIDRLDVSQSELRLGDVLAALGPPSFVEFNLGSTTARQVSVEFRLYYQQPALIVPGNVPADSPYLAAYTPVQTLIYQSMPWGRPALAMNWRGFGSLVRRYYPGGVVP